MEERDITEMTNEELVAVAGGTVIGTFKGLKAQHAQAELLRRNTVALLKASESSDRSANKMMGLTLIAGLIAFLQLMFMIVDSETSALLKVLYSVGVVALLVFVFRDYFGK